jgi:hypothetical protein
VKSSHFHASTGLCCTHFLGSHVAPAGALHVALRHCSIRRPISFIIAIFSGLSGMAVDAVTDLAIFSLVHVIMAAEAGAATMQGAKRLVTAKIGRFIQISLESAGHSGSPKTNCCKFGF